MQLKIFLWPNHWLLFVYRETHFPPCLLVLHYWGMRTRIQKYYLCYLNQLPETSTGTGCVLSTSHCVLLCCTGSKWLSVLLHWFHGGKDWSVNLLHDMFEIFIWGWAVRRCPTHSLLSSRGKQHCQKVTIFSRYSSVLIFMDTGSVLC